MTDSICGATKRDGSEGPCGLPAGWGTDHVGEGRCKLHGGNAGAPSGNQNAAKHGLNADLHHYYQNLDPVERDFIEETASAIEDRIRKNRDTDSVDYMDRVLTREVAIQLHISSKASTYIGKESGLLQEVPSGGSTKEEPAPLLEEVRRFDDAIFQNLKKLGVLDDPQSTRAEVLDSWRGFIGNSPDS